MLQPRLQHPSVQQLRKVAQVPRILGPLAVVLEQLDQLALDPGGCKRYLCRACCELCGVAGLATYLERNYGGVHECR